MSMLEIEYLLAGVMKFLKRVLCLLNQGGRFGQGWVTLLVILV